MPLRLLELNDDALVSVLLALPHPQLRHWVYVALTCRALGRAAVRAFAEAQDRALRASRLPRPRGPEPAPRAMATALGSVMESQWRFVLGKRTLKAPCFLQMLVRSGTSIASSLRYDPRDMRALENREFLAAYNLSTRGIWHLLRDAPLAMIRGCFFDILCEPECQVVDFSIGLRHHRALLMFASFHARVDVLDLLVHKRPQGAKAYDRERGLLRLFDKKTLGLLLNDLGTESTKSTVTRDLLTTGYGHLQVLLIRPAYMSNSPSVLLWIEDVINVLNERFGIRKGCPSLCNLREDCPLALRSAELRHPDVLFGISMSGTGNEQKAARTLFGISMSGTDIEWHGAQWRAARNALREAAGAGATRVLDCVLERGLRFYDRTRYDNGKPRDVGDWYWYDMLRGGRIVFSVLAAVLGAERDGTTHRWLVATCERHASKLFGMASFHDKAYYGGPNDDHTFRFRMAYSELVDEDGVVHQVHAERDLFDLEDLIWVLTGEGSWFRASGLTDMMGVEWAEDVRDDLLRPGDAEYNRWLLNMFAEHPLGGGDPAWPWFARSYAKIRAEAASLVRTRLCPTRWDCRYVLCRHLVRAGQRAIANACARATWHDDQPEGHLYWNRLTQTRHWLPQHGLLGPSRLDDGMAFVLGKWIEHVLQRRPDGREPDADQYHGAHQEWRLMILANPAGCLGPVDDACTAVLQSWADAPDASDAPDQSGAERTRSSLRELLSSQCLAVARTARVHAGDRACAVAYAELVCKHALMNDTIRGQLLRETVLRNPDGTHLSLAAMLPDCYRDTVGPRVNNNRNNND